MKTLNANLKDFSWMTFLVVVIVLIVVIVGGIKVIDNSLGYDEWIKQLIGAGVTAGILGVGRGIHSGLQQHGHGRK